MTNYIEHPASGKTGTFAAKYDQHAERNGQSFTVLGALDPKTYDAEECGTMLRIRFADGAEVEAWPEEVESAMSLQGNESNYIEHADTSKTLGDLYAIWDRFADVPVSEDGAIEAPFLHFSVGVERETIWHWFESQNPRFVVGDVMSGIRHAESGKTGTFAARYDIEQTPPATKLVEVRLSALTRVEYMEVVEVPANITQAELDDLVNVRYRQVDGGEFTSDPEYWERGTCEAVDSDIPDATPTMMAFRTEHGLHIERADAATQEQPTCKKSL